MRLEQVIQDMEDPNKHEIVLSNNELTGWLQELRQAREVIKRRGALIEMLLYRDLRHIDGWISVEDSLPEPEKDVLVWYRYTWGAGFMAYRFGVSKWYSNIKRWYEGCLPKDIEVLYWQPLPEPPKERDPSCPESND